MSSKKSAFQKNKYSVLKGVISKEIADFAFAYFLNKRKAARFLFDQRYISPFTEYLEHGQMNRFLILILIMEI